MDSRSKRKQSVIKKAEKRSNPSINKQETKQKGPVKKKSSTTKLKSTTIDSASHTLAPIECLPRELVWQIIECAPGSVLHLRRASRVLHQFTDAYGMEKRKVSLADSLRLVNEQSDFVPYLSCEVHISSKKAKLFELRMKLRRRSFTMHKISLVMKRYFLSRSLTVYKFHFRDMENYGFLNECLGYKIEKVHLLSRIMKLFPYTDAVKVLNGLQINKVEVEIDLLRDDVYTLLCPSFLGANSVTLSFGRILLSNPKAFFLRLSSHISSISINQSWYNFDPNICGMRYEHFAGVVLEMFSNKLEALNITSFDRAFLSQEQANILRAQLPLLNKKISLTIPCLVYPNGLNYVANGCRVEATNDTLRISNLPRIE